MVDPSPGVPDLVNLGVNRQGIPSNIPSKDRKVMLLQIYISFISDVYHVEDEWSATDIIEKSSNIKTFISGIFNIYVPCIYNMHLNNNLCNKMFKKCILIDDKEHNYK